MDNIELRARLPHGAISEIAKRTNLSTYTISTFLAGKRKTNKEPLILSVIADVLEEYKAKEREARQKLDAILNENSDPINITAP